MTKYTTSIEKKWWIKGLIFENCNCQIICHGHISYRQLCNYERCVGHWAIHIDKGQFLEVTLDDLNWTAYSVLAAMTQWGLHISALLSHNLVIINPLIGGILLTAAGVFQWTPFRDACMSKCRSPLGFLLAEWREGRPGALVMGLKHGLNCVGCCWLLMLLSFVLGIMNMVWMAILTIFMLVEKASPKSQWISRTTGLVLVAWGLWIAAETMH